MLVDIEDHSSLKIYLEHLGKINRGENFKSELLTGGVSNKTVLLTRAGGDQWVIKQALDKLRVKEDWYCDTDRIITEYQGLKWFSEVLPPGSVPGPVFFDEENHVFCMTAVPLPHDNLRALILDDRIEIALFQKLGRLLGLFQEAGRKSDEARILFRRRDFFKDLRIEPFYEFTSEQLPHSRAFYNSLIARTLDVSETISHGDYSPKNVLVKDGDVVLLDFEVTHLGDPAFDIGFFLCQMLCFANHLKPHRIKIQQASNEFWKSYLSEVEPLRNGMMQRAVDHTLGCLLARVKGRSPVNFLMEAEQETQISITLRLIRERVSNVPDLIEKFIYYLDKP